VARFVVTRRVLASAESAEIAAQPHSWPLLQHGVRNGSRSLPRSGGLIRSVPGGVPFSQVEGISANKLAARGPAP
jgi:hypothetical protein